LDSHRQPASLLYRFSIIGNCPLHVSVPFFSTSSRGRQVILVDFFGGMGFVKIFGKYSGSDHVCKYFSICIVLSAGSLLDRINSGDNSGDTIEWR
jgi:hypothetical protein